MRSTTGSNRTLESSHLVLVRLPRVACAKCTGCPIAPGVTIPGAAPGPACTCAAAVDSDPAISPGNESGAVGGLLQCFEEQDHYLLQRAGERRFVFIPKRSFASTADEDMFRSLVQLHTTAHLRMPLVITGT